MNKQTLVIVLIAFIVCGCTKTIENTPEDIIVKEKSEDEVKNDEVKDDEISEEETDNIGTLLWDFEAEGDIRSTIVILDTLLIFNDSDKSNLYAVGAASGNLVWKTPLASLSRLGSGPVLKNEAIYIGTTGGTFAINAKNGEILWEAEIFTDGRVWADDEKVYVSSWNGIHALDATNGNSLWHFMTEGTIFEPSFYGGVTATNGKVYAGSLNGFFYCLDAENGDKLWEYDSESPIVNSSISYEGLIIFGGGDTWGLNLNDGQKVWGNTNSVSNEPFETDNKIFYTSSLTLYCVDANDGETIWSKHAFGQRDYHPFTVFEEKLYTSISGGQGIYTFDIQTGGEPKLVYSIPSTEPFGGIFSRPIIKDGVIYFGSSNNKFYAVKLPVN